MTDLEAAMCEALRRVTMLPGSRPKRFARDMAQLLKIDRARDISPAQSTYLRDLVRRFRRQIPNHAELLAPPSDIVDAVKIVVAGRE